MKKEYVVELREEEADELMEEHWVGELVRCQDCKYRSLYCTEAADGTTLYTCHHPCANDVPRPFYWFCADGERKDDDG